MNPILMDIPSEFTTDRLRIRMPMPGDGKALYEAVRASLEELKDWLPFAQKEMSEEEAEIALREGHLRFLKREDLWLLLFDKDTNQLIGSSGLHRINWYIPKFEIGYWIDTRYSGQGYMTEAVEGIAQYAFNDLKAKRVEIRCDALNVKSRAVAERLGFPLEVIMRNEGMSADGTTVRDTCVYAKIQ
ncbi:acetyltransferase [Paenibacillus swuensis]|uniref:Acetyltransferase n=1 Tax=Paenibacillus swuensis TaxID=1178515 RepID=A0A172TNR2_9BACL|nr:GNAT family N-acetyltransferase [Paenibacillus swuensis]ANE48701.1 acetyltransferase [Paenibacillus swuensis]